VLDIKIVLVEPITSAGRSVRVSLLRTCAAAIGSQGKLMYFPWLPIERALPILTQKFVVAFFFEKEIMKTQEIAINHNLYENVYLE